MKKIYIYETPKSKIKGFVKIGQTTKNDVHDRIKEQINTAAAFSSEDLEYTLLGEFTIIDSKGNNLGDHELHKILEKKGFPKIQFEYKDKKNKKTTEWFKIDYKKVEFLINEINKGKNPLFIDIDRINNFSPRPEQEEAINKTFKAFKHLNYKEFLWNAKMRFGKTFTTYKLMKKMDFKNVLILTYKPAVMSQWAEDLNNHVDFKDYIFLNTDDINEIENLNDSKKVVFLSYQDILSSENNEIKDKHKSVFKIEWDMIVIDEYHYGATTDKARTLMSDKNKIHSLVESISKETEEIEEGDKINIEEEQEEIEKQLILLNSNTFKFKYRLYLSGTPFKALRTNYFQEEQIFNWTYIDEQRAKKEWFMNNSEKEKNLNPYYYLPKIKLFIYEVSEKVIKYGLDNNQNKFSLNQFFKADNKKEYSEEKEKAIQIWLNTICGFYNDIDSEIMSTEDLKKDYPYESDININHTLWYLPDVNSAKALANVLEKHSYFRTFKIILAVGGESKSGSAALPPVVNAIENNEKTITLSCGMLTTGVSVPEWNGVFFLRDIKSPESYFQTAFRSQTPNKSKDKTECYIFDFDPTRSLELLAEYSQGLASKSSSEVKIVDTVTELIEYLPVLQSKRGKMTEINAEEVLTYKYMSFDAETIGKGFQDSKLVNVSDKILDSLNSGEIDSNLINGILNKIKKFKKFNAEDSKNQNKIINIGNLAENNKTLEKLEKKQNSKEGTSKEENKEIDKLKNEKEKEKQDIRELLRTLLSRIPLFMYLTDASEDSLLDIIRTNKKDLFRKTTGIEPIEFEKLIEIGILKVESIEGYIIRYKNLESKNFDLINKMLG